MELNEQLFLRINAQRNLRRWATVIGPNHDCLLNSNDTIKIEIKQLFNIFQLYANKCLTNDNKITFPQEYCTNNPISITLSLCIPILSMHIIRMITLDAIIINNEELINLRLDRIEQKINDVIDTLKKIKFHSNSWRVCCDIETVVANLSNI